MYDSLQIFQMAGAAARHAGTRQSVTAQNMANADTPGYRARDVEAFADSYAPQDSMAMKATRSNHILPDDGASGAAPGLFDVTDAISPNGNSVSLEEEMLKSVESERQQDRALAIYRHAMTVLRTSIGAS